MSQATKTAGPTIRDQIAALVEQSSLQAVAIELDTSRGALGAYLAGRAKRSTTYWIEVHAARVLSRAGPDDDPLAAGKVRDAALGLDNKGGAR